jgi:hypothetical protein
MHKLGEQWVEEIDGKKHMLKAVERPEEDSHISARVHPCFKCFFQMDDYDCAYPSDKWVCDMQRRVIIKDLGVLNEDGCLPEERTGKYPTIKDRNEDQGWLGHIWDCIVCEKIGNDDEAIGIRVSALTRQEAIERWNRRA